MAEDYIQDDPYCGGDDGPAVGSESHSVRTCMSVNGQKFASNWTGSLAAINVKTHYSCIKHLPPNYTLTCYVKRNMTIPENPEQQAWHKIIIKIYSSDVCGAVEKQHFLETDSLPEEWSKTTFSGKAWPATQLSMKVNAPTVLAGRLPKLISTALEAQVHQLLSLLKKEVAITLLLMDDEDGIVQRNNRLFEQRKEAIGQAGPYAAWFAGAPRAKVLDPGTITKIDDLPLLPRLAAEMVFHDRDQYQLYQCYGITHEQHFQDARLEWYRDRCMSGVFLEIPLAVVADNKATVYLLYVKWDKELDRPKEGDPFQLTFTELEIPEFVQPELHPKQEEIVIDDVCDNKADRQSTLEARHEAEEEHYRDLADGNLLTEARKAEECNPNQWKAIVRQSDLTPDEHVCFIVLRPLEPRWPSNAVADCPFVDTDVPAIKGTGKDYEEIQLQVESHERVAFTLQPEASKQTWRDEMRTISHMFHSPEAPKHMAEYIQGRSTSCQEKDLLALLGPLRIHEAFNKDQQKAYDSLGSIPEGIALFIAPFGTGKTFFATTVMLELVSQNEPDLLERRSALFVTSSNAAVDDAALALSKLASSHNQALSIIRVHSLPDEQKQVLKKYGTTRQPRNRFSEDISEMDAVLGAFWSDLYLNSVAQEEKQKLARGDRRRVLEEMSLSAAMLKKLNSLGDAFDNLRASLKAFSANEEDPCPGNSSTIKEDVRELMIATLADADVIFCTLNCATKVNLYQNINPDLVVLDEAARAREPASLAAFAFYRPTAWILLGDQKQLRPTVMSAGRDRQDRSDVSLNPFQAQLMTSLFTRLVAVGHPTHLFTQQYRCQGNISTFPSKRWYSGQVIPGYRPQVHTHVSNFKDFARSKGARNVRGNGTNTILVDVIGAVSKKEPGGNSTINPDNVEEGLKWLREILSLEWFQGEDDKVLFIPLYKGQVHLYQKRLNRLTPLQRARVSVRTADASQGFEASVVIVDLVRTTAPDFVNEGHRLCVALTRAKYFSITLASSECIAGVSKGRIANLYEMFLDFEQRQCVITSNVKPGCQYCKAKDHISDECSKQPRCRRCNDPTHKIADCTQPEACFNCGDVGHHKTDCPRPMKPYCKLCGQSTHVKRDCPMRTCKTCGKDGHSMAECSDKVCARCGKTGHISKYCTLRKTEDYFYDMHPQEADSDEPGSNDCAADRNVTSQDQSWATGSAVEEEGLNEPTTWGNEMLPGVGVDSAQGW